MTHYETLGVPPDATADEIKAAYRRASSAAHPDKGGSTEAQQRVNAAWECLGDPQRRQQYDETGSDEEVPSIRAEAIDVLRMTMNNVLMELVNGSEDYLRRNTTDPATEIRRRLQLGLDGLIEQQAQLTTAERRLTLQRRKVRRKRGDGCIWAGLIDAKLAAIAKQRIELKQAEEVARESLVVYDDYEGDGIQRPQHFISSYQLPTGTGF